MFYLFVFNIFNNIQYKIVLLSLFILDYITYVIFAKQNKTFGYENYIKPINFAIKQLAKTMIFTYINIYIEALCMENNGNTSF